MIVTLKRFDNFRRKIKKHVSYTTSLDLSKLVSDNTKQKYNLISILIHDGFSTQSGHYYSYVKNLNGAWYCMNDSSVTQVNLSHVLNQNPYMLFYEKEIQHEIINIEPSKHKVSNISNSDLHNTNTPDKVNNTNTSIQESNNQSSSISINNYILQSNGKQHDNSNLNVKIFF